MRYCLLCARDEKRAVVRVSSCRPVLYLMKGGGGGWMEGEVRVCGEGGMDGERCVCVWGGGG